MFGNLGAFVNGNMFAGLFGSTIGVKLIEGSSRAELEVGALRPRRRGRARRRSAAVVQVGARVNGLRRGRGA
jgi:TfoX/Sxy family transcriptional regulator of competence genes